MRVALIAPDIPDYCLEFAELAAGFCDVKLFIPDRYIHPERLHARQRLTFVGLPWPRQSHLLHSAMFIEKLARRVRAWAPDIVHILAEGNVWMNLLCALMGNRPVLTTVHDVQFHPGDDSSRRIPHFLIHALIRRSDAIIVHGEELRQSAIRDLSVRPERIFVVPHLPLTFYRELASRRGFSRPSDNTFRVLFFGRIYDYKGLRYLLEAAPLVHTAVPNVKFVIAGSGADFEKYRAQIEALSYFEVDHRFIPPEEGARLFAEADVLVLPYIEASQSGVLMIAMPFCLPTVSTNVGELGATIEKTGTGLLVPPKDSEALATAVIRLAQDEGLRRQLSQNAKRAMAGEYSNNTLSERLANVYQQVLAGFP